MSTVSIPDLYAYNANEYLEELLRDKSSFWIYDDVGGIQATLEIIFNVYCQMDFAPYPTDSHRCDVMIGSKMFGTDSMTFTSATDDGLQQTALPFTVTLLTQPKDMIKVRTKKLARLNWY